MAAVVGTIRADLVADTKKFESGMKRGTAATKQFVGGADTATAALKKMAIAAAGIMAVGKLKSVFAGTMESVDATMKLSAQLGVASEELIKLRHAADQTGAGAASLDAGLATMAKRLGEAARGGGAAAPALKELGLSAQQLAAMAPDKAFIAIAAALESIEEPAKRNAIAANIFSKANMGLLNTLSVGKEGLMDYGAEAERLGITFGKEAAGVEAANDALDRMGKVWKGVWQKLVIAVAPVLELIADLLIQITDAAKLALSPIVFVGKKFGLLAEAAPPVEKLTKAVVEIGEEMEEVGDKTEKATKKVVEGISKVEQSINKTKLELATFGMSQGQKSLVEAWLGGATTEQLNQLKKLQQELEQLEHRQKKAAGGGAQPFTNPMLQWGTQAARSAEVKLMMGQGEQVKEEVKIRTELERQTQILEDLKRANQAEATEETVVSI